MKKIITLLVLLTLVAFGVNAQVIVFSQIDSARLTTAGGLTGTTPIDSGKLIQISGIVYGPNSYPTDNGQSFWLNDGTAGIKIYSKHVYTDYVNVNTGDSITVVGTLTDYYGSAEVDLFDTVAADTIIYNGAGVADTPIVILTSGFSPQTYGTLVQVNNVDMTTATGWVIGSKHYFTADANGLYIYIDSFTSTALFHEAQPQGTYNVVGIGDDYSPTEFNLDPRSPADFIPVTTGINTIAGLTAMVYPNPATTQVNVSFSSEMNQPVISKMYDVLGNEVIAQTTNAVAGINNVRLNTEALANGLYILDVRVGNKALVTKVSINR